MSYDDEVHRLIEIIKQSSRWTTSIKKKASELGISVILGFLDENADLHQFVDEDGLQVTRRDLEYEDVLGTAGSGTAVFTPSETIEVVSVLADMDADGNAGDRNVTVALNRTLRASGASVVVVAWRSQTVTVAVNQYGLIWLLNNRSDYYYVSANGTLSASTVSDNPVPFLCTTVDTIACQYTGAKAGDNAHLRVWYRKIKND